MMFCRVKDFLVHRRSVDPAQAWTDSIRRSMRWHVLPRLFNAEIRPKPSARAEQIVSALPRSGGHYGQRSGEPRKQAEHMAAPTNAAK